MKEKHEQVERLQADMAEASEKNDVPKMKELLKEALSINAMYKQNLARIEKNIVGKKIPVAIAYNLCLKMDSGLVVRKVKGADPMIYCTAKQPHRGWLIPERQDKSSAEQTCGRTCGS